MNGKKRHGESRNLKRAGELGIDMPEIYGGGGLDFTFNA
jgi:hypothetical protein